MANATTSTVELIKEEDDKYSFNTTSTFRSQELKFSPGVEFMEKRMDGAEVSTVVTLEGNKMIQLQKVIKLKKF